jgi:hypothetical protein
LEPSSSLGAFRLSKRFFQVIEPVAWSFADQRGKTIVIVVGHPSTVRVLCRTRKALAQSFEMSDFHSAFNRIQ